MQPRLALQRGVTLIEVLITMVVVAVGLLGAAGLQLASTRFQQTAFFRTQAFQQAEFIIEKIRVNNTNLTIANLPNAAATPETAYLAPDDYATADVLPPDPACGLQGQAVCTPAVCAARSPGMARIVEPEPARWPGFDLSRGRRRQHGSQRSQGCRHVA